MASDSDAGMEAILLRNRQRQKQDSRRLLLIIAASFLVVLAGGWMYIRSTSSTAAESWTHIEMCDYLRKRGVDCYVIPAGGGSVYYCDVALKGEIDHADWAEDAWRNGRGNVILVETRDNKEAARLRASESSNWASYGRFVFRGRCKMMDDLKKAIGAS